MSRFIPNVIDHLPLFDKELQKKITDIAAMHKHSVRNSLRMPMKDYLSIYHVMKEKKMDIARGIKIGGFILLPLHPAAENAGKSDVLQAKNTFEGVQIQEYLGVLQQYIEDFNCEHVHIYQDDFDLIQKQMDELGFDVSQGVFAGNKQLIPVMTG